MLNNVFISHLCAPMLAHIACHRVRTGTCAMITAYLYNTQTTKKKTVLCFVEHRDKQKDVISIS